jgi:hypothetical protein
LVRKIRPSLRETAFFFMALPNPILNYSFNSPSTTSLGVPSTLDSWYILASGVPLSV